MGKRDQDALDGELGGAFASTSVEHEIRGSVVAKTHLDLTPPDCARERVSREGLVRRFLCRDAGREMQRSSSVLFLRKPSTSFRR